MPNPMDAILARIERGNQRRKANALNDIFAKSYEPGASIPFVDEQAQAMGLPQELGMVAGYQPGRINEQNALAMMAQSKDPGMAMQAYALQKDMDARSAEAERLRQTGMTASRSNNPMSVQETQWFMQQPREIQKQHLALKRAQQLMNLGGTQAVLDPTTGQISQSYAVTPKPEQMPAFRGQQAAAEATAKSNVGIQEEAQKKSIKAESMIDYINQANKLLDKASGSLLGAGYSRGKQMVGVSDETTQANQKLKLISGWMVANVPRMEGPQSNFDVQNYMTMAGVVGDSTIPVEDRKAALQTLIQLQSKYADKKYAGVSDVTNEPQESRNTAYKVNGLTKGPDGRMYLIRSLKPDGTPDEVIPAQ